MSDPLIHSQDPGFDYPQEGELNSSPVKKPKAKRAAPKRNETKSKKAKPAAPKTAFKSRYTDFVAYCEENLSGKPKQYVMEALKAFKEHQIQMEVDGLRANPKLLNTTVGFGKYSESTWIELWEDNDDPRDSGRSYLKWIMEQEDFNPRAVAAARYLTEMQACA